MLLTEARAEAAAKAAQLEVCDGDLQHLRRELDAAQRELSTYRTRTTATRALLGMAVREQCAQQMAAAHALATPPPPPAPPPPPPLEAMPEACTPPMGDSITSDVFEPPNGDSITTSDSDDTVDVI